MLAAWLTIWSRATRRKSAHIISTIGRRPIIAVPTTLPRMADSLMGVSKTRSPRAGLLIAVNQQLRYDEGMAAARAMVQAGWIGKVTAKTFTVNVTTDWAPWPWLVHSDRLEIMYHS